MQHNSRISYKGQGVRLPYNAVLKRGYVTSSRPFFGEIRHAKITRKYF